MPYVNHYSFHIWDPKWGHITLKISGHPPFPAQVILNGHEYVACQARRKKIDFEKEGNCFTRITDAAGLAQIADTLSEERMIGRLTEVCERWIYTTCLCFALSLEEQERSEFHYQYSVYQAEYSRNLLFQRGARMEQVFQAMVDRSRAPLGIERVKTLLGCKRRPTFHRKTACPWRIANLPGIPRVFALLLECGNARSRDPFHPSFHDRRPSCNSRRPPLRSSRVRAPQTSTPNPQSLAPDALPISAFRTASSPVGALC